MAEDLKSRCEEVSNILTSLYENIRVSTSLINNIIEKDSSLDEDNDIHELLKRNYSSRNLAERAMSDVDKIIESDLVHLRRYFDIVND